jgi:hypothetical protein
MAQMIRAILLARATAATLRRLRSSNRKSQVEADLLPGLATRTTAVAPTTRSWRSRSSPALLILPRPCLPPVECSGGVSPSQAAKCRPDAKFGAATINPSLLTAAERIQYEGYLRREDDSVTILRLAKDGTAIKEIVRLTG